MTRNQLILKRNRLERELEILEDNEQDGSANYYLLDKELNEVLDQLNEAEEQQKKRDQEQLEQHRLDQFKLKIKSKYDMDFDEWYEKAKAMYVVTDNFTVISNASNWKEDKTWEFSSKIDALEKVEQLIDWKYYDHFVREKQ